MQQEDNFRRLIAHIRRALILLFAIGLSSIAQAQSSSRQIRGKVVDGSTGEALIATSVRIVGTTTGATTNINGEFTLTLPAGKSKLLVSYIGYQDKEVEAKDGITIKLTSDSKALDEVVVMGMTKMDKRLFTGATAKISGDKSKLNGVPDVARALEGKAAGVSVQNVSGTFGSAPKIRVRGATSILGSSKPLWVVDGVIVDDVIDVPADALASGDANTLISSAIAGLNADDIESFQVLKDGSATSIYGARAMAGVIAITTKKGRAGTSRISYTGEYTYRAIPSYSDFNVMNSQRQMSFYKELQDKGYLSLAETSNAPNSGVYGKMWSLVNRGLLDNTIEAQNDYLRSEAEYRNTNWFRELFNSNLMSNHSVSITSGTEKTSYYASLSAMVDPGWTKQSKVNRYTANLNMTYNLSQKLSINMIASAALRKQRAPGSSGQGIDYNNAEFGRNYDINPYSYALSASRTLNPQEFYTRYYAPFNIHHELDNNYMDIGAVDLKYQAELKWKPIQGLEISALGDIKYNASNIKHTITENSNEAESYRAMATSEIREHNSKLYKDPDLPYARNETVLPEGGFYKNYEYALSAWDFRLSGSYVRELGPGLFNAFAGMEVNSYDRNYLDFRLPGVLHKQGLIGTLYYPYYKQMSEHNDIFYKIERERYRNVALFANVTYSLLGRYTLNGTIRYEGSNKFGRSDRSRWLPTWNTSAAWSVDRESFFRDHLSRLFSHLTLKASYSLTADRGPESATNTTTIYKANVPWRAEDFMKETAFIIEAPANKDLTYEKKHELNLGVETGFFGGRINLNVDWYKRNNFDLIGSVATSGLVGTSQTLANAASMTSSGLEFSLSTTNVKTKDFSWSTDFIYSHATNKITKYSNQTNAFVMLVGAGFAKEGFPVRSIFYIPFQGLTEQGLPTFYNQDNVLTSSDIEFQELSKLDFIKYAGSADPTDFGSLGNTLSYKDWTLNVFLTYAFGNIVRLSPAFQAEYNDLMATPREFENRYVKPGDEKLTDVPVILSKRQIKEYPSINRGYKAYNFSDKRLAKGDFVRLKEISLAYNFPQAWAKKLYVSNLSLKLQATNLLLLYTDKKLNGQDPEFINAGGVATPLPRQFTLTLRVGI